jgi:hypothetical protein
VYLLVFHTYINEMHGSRSKIPSKILSGSVARRDLIPVLKFECSIMQYVAFFMYVIVYCESISYIMCSSGQYVCQKSDGTRTAISDAV